MNKVVCGSVREASRDETTHAYGFMDPSTVTQDELAAGKYQCHYDQYYKDNDDNFDATV